MAGFFHVSGPARADAYQKLASTAIASGSVLGFRGSGYVSQAIAQSTRVAGVALRKIASTDDDFASATTIPVVVPSDEDIFEASVSGTATQANVGKQYDLTAVEAGTAQSVNLSGTTYKVVTVVGVLSTSKVLVKFNGYISQH